MALRVAHFALPVAERQGYLGLRPCPKFDDGNGDLANFAVVQETKRMTSPDFDLAAAHRHFSAACFNGVWELIDKPDRSPDEDRLMVSMCHASLYHWQQRPDCTSRSLSIGYWQLSRVYALLEQADNARHYGRLCLAHSQNEEPFYLGYAYEALARAEFLAGNRAVAEECLTRARLQSAKVVDAGEREMLRKDLETLKAVADVALPVLIEDELNAVRQSLIAEIHDAFAEVSREGGVSWSETTVIDDYGDEDECTAARLSDNDTHWSQLVDDSHWITTRGVGGFSFLDPIGFRYYLPPVLIRTLRGDEDVPDLHFHLNLADSEHSRNQQSLLDNRQRRCVARSLLIMARENDATPGHDVEWWLSVLNSGWRESLDG